MKKLASTMIALGMVLAAQAADPAIGRLPNGTYYLKEEINFSLKAEVAQELSPVGAGRRPVDKARLRGLHRAAREVVAAHSGAERWLKGEGLPARVAAVGEQVPNPTWRTGDVGRLEWPHFM